MTKAKPAAKKRRTKRRTKPKFDMLLYHDAHAHLATNRAYWYCNMDSIEVYIETRNGVAGCTISRKDLIRWLEATAR